MYVDISGNVTFYEQPNDWHMLYKRYGTASDSKPMRQCNANLHNYVHIHYSTPTSLPFLIYYTHA